MSKKRILEIIEELRKNGWLTNSKIHGKVYERFKNSDDPEEIVKFILTSCEPKGVDKCSRCYEILSTDQFSFYQARVDQKGFLSRSNALCKVCSKKINKERQDVFKKQKDKIPPEPKKGSVCPNCSRVWEKLWQNHHSERNRFLKQIFEMTICL